MSLEKDAQEIKNILEKKPIFKAASAGQIANRDKFSRPVMISPEVKRAIERILEYSYHDEKKYWEEGTGEEYAGQLVDENYIFHAMQILADFIGWTE